MGRRKQTHTTLLARNGWKLETTTPKIVEMVLEVESDEWKVDEIENWLRLRARKW